MKDAETFLESAGETAEYARQYLKLQLDYWRLDAAEKGAKAASTLISSLAVAALGLMALLMLTVAGALYLGALWQSYALGFLSMAGFYVLLMLFVLLFKKRLLTNPVLTSLIRSFFD